MARSSFSQKIRHAAAVAALVVGVQSVQAQDSDIVDIAVNNGSFNTLVAALVAADLVDVLRGDGPFTVFAPTDDAFAALPEGTVESLLLPENKDLLVAILTYHVVPGRLLAADVVSETSLPTVNGDDLAVDASGSGVKINAANIVLVDIEGTNGVIHVIDAVILPGAPTAVEATTWGAMKDSPR
jgi:uncharacterized surface protein with fasciclin (FAS1) repeats